MSVILVTEFAGRGAETVKASVDAATLFVLSAGTALRVVEPAPTTVTAPVEEFTVATAVLLEL
jgi:hypothetical protein